MWRTMKSRIRVRNLRTPKQLACMYHQGAHVKKTAHKDVHIVDLRSDVLTQPTPQMRKLISEAQLADDVFGECSVTNALQDRVAKLFGKEAALFVPSGTMGNLISVLAHCPERGREVILGDKSHIFLWEQGGISQLGGLHSNTIPNLPDGTFPTAEIDNRVRPTNDAHYPLTGLICVENTHNFCSGSVVPLDWLQQVQEKAREHKLPVHMDGARVMNAVVALKITPEEILRYVDSVNMCFSKGLGAPVGSIIAGSGQFIERAHRLRKVMGGGWRQPGLLAAAADYCLDHAEETMRKDHHHAQILAKALHEHGQGVLSVNPQKIHTNILMVDITKEGLTAEQFCQRLAQIPPGEETNMKNAVQIKSLPFTKTLVRFVTQWNLTENDIQAVIDKCLYVINELK